MSSVMFPDFLGTLGKAAAFENASAQRDWLDEDRKAKAEVAPLIPKALQGDKEALGQIGTRHPDTAMKLAPLLERMDASQRAKAKESAEFITSNGMAILNAPPEQQPQIYARVRQEAQAAGRDVSSWPTTYDPGWVKFNVDKAMPFAEHFKRSGEGVTFAPPAGGGGGASAPGSFTGQVSKDESGGNYNISNAKGSGAYGKYQFMPDTWASVAQANPQLNLPMNMRQATPQQQEAAMEAFTRANGQALQQAGQPATAANLYLAHRFGTQGATKFLSMPDNTPISQVFPPKWIEQNPDLNTTVGQFKRSVQSRYGGMPVGREVDVATNAAPIPQPPGGMAVPGTPAPMPDGPPGLAIGSDMPRADGSGTPIPPAQQALAPLKGLQIPPGARVALQGGVPIVKDGNVLYLDANGGWGAAPLPSRAAPKEQGAGPFAGTGMDAQAMNLLLRGDPASPEYALAYSHLSKPRTTLDEQGRPVTIQPMDLSAVRKPAGVAAAPAAVGGGTTTALPGGGSVTVGESVAPKGPSAKELADIKTARTEAETIITALEDFRKEFKSADTLTRGKSALGMTTGLNTSYNVAALLAKGEALFNLGVLNGPDLDIIRRTLPDPSTMKGAGTGAGDMSAAVDKVISIINTRLQSKEQQLGITAETTKPPQPGAKAGTYMGPDNKPISWQEIETTAKNRGITPDEVVRRLGLKPTGMQ